MALYGIAAGYVVQAKLPNRFLSRSKRFVKHSNRSNALGIERAYAHTEQDVLAGGDWAVEAAWVIPAQYNSRLGYTIVMGELMPYATFLATHSQTV